MVSRPCEPRDMRRAGSCGWRHTCAFSHATAAGSDPMLLPNTFVNRLPALLGTDAFWVDRMHATTYNIRRPLLTSSPELLSPPTLPSLRASCPPWCSHHGVIPFRTPRHWALAPAWFYPPPQLCYPSRKLPSARVRLAMGQRCSCA